MYISPVISMGGLKNMSEKKQVLIMRVFIAIFIVISAFIALNKDKLGYIADMMGISQSYISRLEKKIIGKI